MLEDSLARSRDAEECAAMRVGAILKKTALSKGGRPGKTGNTLLPVLKDLGVEKIQSSRWQGVSEIPAATLAKYERECNRNEVEVTEQGLRRFHRDQPHLLKRHGPLDGQMGARLGAARQRDDRADDRRTRDRDPTTTPIKSLFS